MRTNYHFWVLISIVAISGFSQGMLLPIIAVIFEQDGVSSSLNGLHATALYLGVLLASPFMEVPLKKWGYKPLILAGGFTVIASLMMFPLWKSFTFWFVLRLLIGIGDHMLHFATQTWITSASPKEKRGRNISLYGLFFGIGFACGPFMTPLVETNESLPFIVSSLISLLAWLTVWGLKNEFPESSMETNSFFGSLHRFGNVMKFAWVALLPPFGYGFLEASLNGNFPIYALRSGITVETVSILLPAFAIGGIVFQLPLGMLSDRYGRPFVLLFAMAIGTVSFFSAEFIDSTIGLFIAFFVAGMVVGSTFSLGISYMADLLPKSLLPAGNIMCGMVFSIGSILGPIIGGTVIQWNGSFFYMISGMLFLIFLALAFFQKQQRQEYAPRKKPLHG
jgi:MFS family permease